MGATGITFLLKNGIQRRPGSDGGETRVQVFFFDKKDKPAQSGRYERLGLVGGPDAAIRA